MSNLKDLNAHLFAQLDRLSSAQGGELTAEIDRAKAVAVIASTIVKAADTQVAAVALVAEHGQGMATRLDMSLSSAGSKTKEAPPAIEAPKEEAYYDPAPTSQKSAQPFIVRPIRQ